MHKRLMLKVYGEVQGVFFRAQTKKKADELGLVGWVKNEADGSVKVVAQGEDERLNQLIDWCYNIPSANVERIEIHWSDPLKDLQEFKDFRIIY